MNGRPGQALANIEDPAVIKQILIHLDGTLHPPACQR